jgi:hypothetical protein
MKRSVPGSWERYAERNTVLGRVDRAKAWMVTVLVFFDSVYPAFWKGISAGTCGLTRLVQTALRKAADSRHSEPVLSSEKEFQTRPLGKRKHHIFHFGLYFGWEEYDSGQAAS